MFFVKTQRTPTQTDTTILSVYSLSLVTIITGHLILTKISKGECFVHFFARERQSDSPRKTSTLRCQMQAQRPIFCIDCRKTVFHNKTWINKIRNKRSYAVRRCVFVILFTDFSLISDTAHNAFSMNFPRSLFQAISRFFVN
jgi:hypothetical protein